MDKMQWYDKIKFECEHMTDAQGHLDADRIMEYLQSIRKDPTEKTQGGAADMMLTAILSKNLPLINAVESVLHTTSH